jgi:hypothetical protein
VSLGGNALAIRSERVGATLGIELSNLPPTASSIMFQIRDMSLKSLHYLFILNSYSLSFMLSINLEILH